VKKQLLTGLLAGGLMAAMLPGVAAANFINGPSSPGIVERFSEPGIGAWFDEEDGLAVFANANSLADVCNFNPAGPGELQDVTLPNGVIVGLLHDDNVPVLVLPLAPEGVDPCEDPGNYPVIATGTGNVRGNDNDVEVSLSRNNTFGQRLTGRVIDGNGQAWSVQANFRAKITQNDEFVLIRENVNLVKRGN
jgi:hypothetical protein